MAHGHFRNECKHGIVAQQCRCMSPTKLVTIVPCPPMCVMNKPDDDTPDPDAFRPGEVYKPLDSFERKTADKAISLLKEWRSTLFFDDHAEWQKWVQEFGTRVDNLTDDWDEWNS